MARINTTLRLLLLLLLAATTTTAIPTSSNLLVSADTEKCPSDQEQCGSSLPDNFCCPSDYTCMPLAGNTTAVCCPSGSDCAKISPITCNVSQQDPKKNPKAPVKTTVFDVDLEECGQGCCPFGYSCHEGKECRLDEDQEESPAKEDDTSSSTTTTTKGGSTSTGRPTGSLTETELPIITSDPDDNDSESDNNTEDGNADGGGEEEKDSGPDTTTIIGGIVGGVAALLALAVIIFVCARRRANRDPNKSPSSSKSSPNATSQVSRSPPTIGLNISDPIAEQNSYRTDFARKANTNSVSSSMNSDDDDRREMAGAAVQRHHSVHPRISTVSLNNPFQEPSPTSPLASQRYSGATEHDITNGRVVGGRLAPIRGMKPSSSYGRTLTPGGPRRESDDDGRSINIDVFADPVTVDGRGRQNSTMTTFSAMMEQVKSKERNTPPPRPGNFV